MFKFKKKNLISFAASCLLLILIALSIPALRTPFLTALKAPLSLFTLLRREFGAMIFYHRNFIENEKLNKEIDLLRNNLNAQKEAYLENARLKELLVFKQKSALKLVAARVIARSADSWSSCIIIDKGRHSGIGRGMAVITYLGLAGRVIEAQEFTSKIILLNDPGLSISSLVQRSRQEGLVSGTLGNNLIMRYLPEDADIKADDLIVTSGLLTVT